MIVSKSSKKAVDTCHFISEKSIKILFMPHLDFHPPIESDVATTYNSIKTSIKVNNTIACHHIVNYLYFQAHIANT